ncbi:putative leucine-rich repeat domain superfamily, transport inhibitor response 1 [Helianthus annuus]|uniref:protein TRANSPORT INHIBITOR RESPONSE 1 isoform X2 n=1 Tax=Helianthus annuus TaxID=4232 RepID=UPI000B8FDA4D|nr:protein TRANSPORT INHIBITOR RESPONSE 1 isoform X2 [Helianthus annuus]KAJ0502158.1 putative leucine-rich repeat domain superfamily, transport inhibitor response 1 [Helianthus annuus]KAJ0518079.1 putative leucine-rich repeat domain superfamily, transport inhibitor response 1 [Helianthus annuus]KAJ0686105.1 putative leucine-rich repeat domain superfamily, transport inhibitor response 1 [Helianthus annuus]KAJ0689952.1 putative leucine-rich repeat domain superfamily, transport inhibitor response 
MDLNQKRTRMVDRVDSVDPDLVSPESTPMCPFPDEVLEPVLSLINSHKDRSSVSLVCKDWYNAERWSRRHVFIGNCYSVSPEIVVGRFPKIRSVTLKGKPRFSDFNLVPEDWGADVYPWLSVLAKAYPFLEELRLKRMAVSDESLEFLAMNFPEFKALSLLSCDGFSTDGLKAIATHCRNLAELDIQENGIDDLGGDWLSCFPETLTTLQVLNFASLNSEVNFNDLEKLVTRCKSLRVLKVNRTINLDQLQKLLLRAPQLTELGTGTFTQDLVTRPVADLEATFGSCKNLLTISGLWDTNSLYLPVIYPACASLTFLNLSCAALRSFELAMLLIHCKSLRRLWVLDTVGDMGLEAVGSWCPLLEELRVFPADPFEQENVAGVTESGFVAVSRGCPKLHYVLYFCHQMTNAAVATVVQNCPGSSDLGLKYVLGGCPRLRKLEIRDCPFGNAALLSGLTKYESMRSLWMSACNLTMNGCRVLAKEMPRLNVEVMKDEDSEDSQAHKVYIYRTVAGPRRDAPPFVLTL